MILTTVFLTHKSPQEVYACVNNVRKWWSQALVGNSESLNDVFEYRHGDIHYSQHQVIELVPNEKIVWLTLESKLSFVDEKDEWKDTKMIFEIKSIDSQTQLEITHLGLVPQIQCYNNCIKGWTHYLSNSLMPLIETGIGRPDPA